MSGAPSASGRAGDATMAAGAIAIVLLAALAFAPALGAGFIWDDDDYVTDNTMLHDASGLARIWRPGQTHQYYPLVFTSFWIEYQSWELEPSGYHIDNILLHAACAILVWRLVRRLGVPGAWLVGAVFVLHPVHVESVAWVTERKNVLSGVFYLLAMHAYLAFDTSPRADDGDDGRRPVPRRWTRYALSLVLFACALLSKSVTCSLPAALVLVLFLRRDKLSVRRLLPLAPFFVLGLVAALNTALLERGSVGVTGEAFDQGFLERCLIASRALLFYPAKIVVPWPVMFVYPRWAIDTALPASYLAPAAAVLVGAAVIALAARGRRGPFVALAFYAGTIFPALGFVNVYPHRFSFVADHFQYLASIGLIALFVGLLARVLRRRAQLIAAGVVLLVPLGAMTWAQTTAYENAETIWRDTVEKNDGAWLAHNNLSTILLRRAEARLGAGARDEAARAVAEARGHAERALVHRPTYHLAHGNLSEAMRLQGDLDPALSHQQAAIDLVLERARRAGTDETPTFLAVNYFQLGRLHHLRGEAEEARAAYRSSLDLRPDAVSVRHDLAKVLVVLERYDEAGIELEHVVAAEPANVAALGTLAALAERDGDHAAAERRYRQALAAAAGGADRTRILVRLIRFLARCPDPAYRDLDEAVFLAEGMVASAAGRDPAVLDMLASVYADAGRMPDAIATAEEALSLARATGLEDLARAISARLKEYRE